MTEAARGLANVFGVLLVLLAAAALLIWVERRLLALWQDRWGPNRVGPFGLLQVVADMVKIFAKEDWVPPFADRALFIAAPAVIAVCAITAFAVVPVSPGIGVAADLDIGVLFFLAMTALSVYGLALAGWASNNKYSLLGGLRSSAQMISYEVAMGMSLIPVLLLSGNVTFAGIIDTQQRGLWFVLPLFLSCFIFLVAGFAETNRLPFDLPEAESELIAGYHTEYSAMKFSMFPIAEYANMATVSAMIVTLFFGGWDIPGIAWDQQGGVLQTVATAVLMFLKVLFFLFLFMWIRWTLPRFRYDQLMSLGWKVMLPLALVYIMVTTVAIWVIETVAGVGNPRLGMGILFGLNLVLGYLVFFVLDRGLILSGSYRAPRPAAPGASGAGMAA
jgi:NADH-quinone oxidoreductase subunit H